eukprot:2545892-Pleurochrysis_carterae.AAC.2
MGHRTTGDTVLGRMAASSSAQNMTMALEQAQIEMEAEGTEVFSQRIVALLLLAEAYDADDEDDGTVLVPGEQLPNCKKRRQSAEHRHPRRGDLESSIPGERFRHPSHCSCWLRLLNHEETKIHGSFCAKRFCGLFRVTRQMFDELLEETRQSGLFPTKVLGDSTRGPVPHPIDLKMLACLRYLTTGADFTVISEITSILESTLEIFFHKWMAFGAEKLYSKWGRVPETDSDINANERVQLTAPALTPSITHLKLAHCPSSSGVYNLLGFPGAVCSIDGVHVDWHTCPALQTYLHTGKGKKPTRAFNISVVPTRRILHVTPSHPGARNDKTIAKYDSFMQSMHSGVYKEWKFELCDAAGHKVVRRGLYAIVDGGYHTWRVLQHPFMFVSSLFHPCGRGVGRSGASPFAWTQGAPLEYSKKGFAS